MAIEYCNLVKVESWCWILGFVEESLYERIDAVVVEVGVDFPRIYSIVPNIVRMFRYDDSIKIHIYKMWKMQDVKIVMNCFKDPGYPTQCLY